MSVCQADFWNSSMNPRGLAFPLPRHPFHGLSVSLCLTTLSRTYYLRLCLSVRQISDIPPWTQEAWHFLCLATLSRTYYLRLCLSVRFLRASYRTLSQIRWTKAISPPKELEGGAYSAPNFIFTSQGARRAPIWWPKATSPPQELEVWHP